jgi:hypothetical protein
VQQLRGVVPFVERLALLQPVVALQAQQLALQRLRQRLGQLGLADAGLAFEQQRALQLQREEHGRGQAPVGEVAGLLEPSESESMVGKIMAKRSGRREGNAPCGPLQGWRRAQPSALVTARCVSTLIRLAR